MVDGDLQALLDGLASHLGEAVVLEDIDLRLLAHTTHTDVIDDVRRSTIIGRRATQAVREWFEQWGIRSATEPVRTPAGTDIGALARWCVPVGFRGTHLGYVWVLDRGRLTREAIEPAVQTAEHIGALLYRRLLTAQADSDLLRLLLIPSPETEHIADEIRASGIHSHDGPLAVVVTGLNDERELKPAILNDLALAAHRASDQASAGRVLSGVVSDLGVMITPLRRDTDVGPARELAEQTRRLAHHSNPSLELVGAVGGVASLRRASRSYAEARRALRVARVMPDLGPVVAWDDLGVFRALTLLPMDEIQRGVLDPRVRHLLHDTELAGTAEAFLDSAGSVQKTAERLFVHRATLYQRLDRIHAAYELDLRRSGDHRLLTHLGLKLARLTDV